MSSCEACWAEAHRRGIEYRDMLAIAEREGHPCTKLTLEGAKLRAGQWWDEQAQIDTRADHNPTGAP